MKVLWITNSLLPEAIAQLRREATKQWKTTGSWILGAANALTKQDDIKLYIASVSQDVKELTKVENNGIISYAIPYGKGHEKENTAYNKYMQVIHDEVKPDIVHIHGTEFSQGWAYIQQCGNKHVVISIQGLTSVCYQHFHDGIKISEILRNISFRDLIRGGILRCKASFRKRGEFEKKMIRSVHHIIGRTSWDKAHVKAINSNSIYHFCNETLRDTFYTGEHWKYEHCQPHTIFVSQSLNPFKGLHQLLKALPFVLREFSDTHIVVAGEDPTHGFDKSQWWRLSGYGKYLKKLILHLDLKDHISFIGNIDAERMKSELLHCNVFVIPSAIENSPNSLGEAQILGVPCIASHVGGIMDMMKGNEENLYRYEEVEMLADKICTVFNNREEQVDLSTFAAQRHNPKKNVKDLLSIYNNIINDD